MAVDTRPSRVGHAPLERPVQARAVVALAGHSRSGKSALAAAVADRHGSTAVVRFGDAVRHQAEATGQSPDDPDVLVKLGAQWVESDPIGFCRTVLAHRPEHTDLLLIEGVHHEVIRRHLASLVAPTPMHFVMLKSRPRDIVTRFQVEGKTAEQAKRVLADSTEADVDQVLLAQADLILDATQSPPDNAARVIALAGSIAPAPGQSSVHEYVGGFNRAQRRELISAVASEYRWLLPAEASDALAMPAEAVEELREQRRLLGLEVNGAVLYPSFAIEDGHPNPIAAAAFAALNSVLSDWEIVAWLIANNGYLDGLRPVDANLTEIRIAIDAELGSE